MIPKELKHLPIDERGYVIPFFVAYINGKPDFRMLDIKKQERCINEKLCGVCGKKLPKDSMFFIGGEKTCTNKVCTDPGMHRACAEYSLMTCPHMYFEKAQRREKGLEAFPITNSTLLDPGKPKEIYLIKAAKYKAIPHPYDKGAKLIRFTPIAVEKYYYESGKLVKDQSIT